ncbi:hypothetical protein [Rubrimonas cliftonensis]|uniref:Uncharacterized protein n=1 Tax=Rubrimonas cliftonensis TaxID=89524 RepID=A0A1H4BZ23_9RHOB|nr:hypothetical protein [Rubrimonas cliftonensis]SEA53339.1 hypothetical protein SAMN05444370_106117 [Rubrimonas cliftonensis]
MNAAALAGAAACVVWLAAVAAYAVGYFATPAPGAGAGSALMLLIAAAAPAGALAALVVALGSDRAPRFGGRDADGLSPEAARIATEAARAAAAETARALSVRMTALETALAETRRGVKALTEIAGVDAAERRERPAESARPGPSHTAPQTQRPPNEPALPFADAAAQVEPVAWSDILRALDFPRSDGDAEGFRAMRAALTDPQIAQLLQAAEDVLNILATSGQHMEDLSPEPADLGAWAAYAQGARGAAADGVGAVRTPERLDAARALLRADAVFRDAALVFARRWNGLVARIHDELGGGAVMADAADTRSGRAFMLLTRALGAFD